MTTACSRKVQFANNPQSSKVSLFFDPEPRCFGRLEVFAKGWQQGWLAVEAVCACSKQGQAGGRLREASPVLPRCQSLAGLRSWRRGRPGGWRPTAQRPTASPTNQVTPDTSRRAGRPSRVASYHIRPSADGCSMESYTTIVQCSGQMKPN